MILDVFKNKIIIAFSILVVISVILNSIIYTIALGNLKSANKEADKVSQELNVSKAITQTYEELKQQESSTKDQYKAICELFPKEITQESALNTLKILSDEASVNITNITFDQVQPVKDQSATSMSVKFSFKGSYKGIAIFIQLLNDFKQKISLKQMAFNGFNSQLTGNAVAVLYGYDSSIVNADEPNINSATGKNDLFELFTGAARFAPQSDKTNTDKVTELPLTIKSLLTSTITDNSVLGRLNYDFYVVLNKVSDDAANIIVGKYKQSEITADGNKANWVNIELSEKNGQFGFRYRTDNDVYPDETTVEPFTPVGKGDITIIVFSNAISSAQDKSRMLLNVFNDTSRKVHVIVTGTDGKTRVMKNKFNGDVELSYE